MDEQTIRQWAWDRVKDMTLTVYGSVRPLNLDEALRFADRVAAWVMSGKLPAPPAQLVPNQ